MRIALWHDPPPGGARRALVEVTRRLAGRHQVDVFLLGSNEHGPHPEADYGAPVTVIPFRPRRHRRLAPYWNDYLTFLDLQAVRQIEGALVERIDGGRYDAALVSVLRNGQAPAAAALLDTPAPYFCHEPPRRFYEPWCRPDALPLSPYERARRCWRWPAQALLDAVVRRRDAAYTRRAHLILTNSAYTQGRIAAVYGRRAAVSYLGVDAARWRPAGELPPPSGVISVGALEPHKGFDFLVRAIGRIPAGRRPALTVVAGAGHRRMPAYLERLAAARGVTLRLRRRLRDDELAACYAASALFVFGARHEPFGLVLLEALASGLPVVAVAEGGVGEVVREGVTGRLIARDEGAFGAAVDELLADPRRRRAMRRAARDEAAAWSWEAAADRIEQYLHVAAASGGGGAGTPAHLPGARRAVAQGS